MTEKGVAGFTTYANRVSGRIRRMRKVAEHAKYREGHTQNA